VGGDADVAADTTRSRHLTPSISPWPPRGACVQGDVKKSVLLVSGWWSVSRHFHYLPELAASFFW